MNCRSDMGRHNHMTVGDKNRDDRDGRDDRMGFHNHTSFHNCMGFHNHSAKSQRNMASANHMSYFVGSNNLKMSTCLYKLQHFYHI